jgi:ABC-type branched-subunit amino acid transport system ATPase component
MSHLLEVDGLTVQYGGVRALDGLTLRIEEGSFVGLIGPNGAGKTTCIDAITGLVRASGAVLFAGRDVCRMSPAGRARAGLARTFQTLELFEELTIRENLLVAAERSRWWSPVVEMIGVRHQSDAEAAVADALALLELDDAADVLPTDLSLGQRKLVTVARALSSRPRMVLLDEPAAGLDSEESLTLGRTLRRVVDSGVTLLLVDHDMGLVLSVCETVHVLEFGRLLTSGTPSEVAADAAVIRAYLGAADDEPAGVAR